VKLAQQPSHQLAGGSETPRQTINGDETRARSDRRVETSLQPAETRSRVGARSAPRESDDRIAVAIIGAPESDSARAAAVKAFEAGDIYVSRHEWREAETLFKQALRLDGSVAQYHAALGEVEMILGKWEEAEAEFTAASLLDLENKAYRERVMEARRRKGSKTDEHRKSRVSS
jgi:tetratricopeptide (TPR) repeat protein